jgi:hypothetical protein
MTLDVRFSCNLVRETDALIVSYGIDNRSSMDIGAFDRQRVTRLDGTNDFSDDLVYADLEGSDLHLRKMALPLLAGLQISAYVPPNASLIPAETKRDVTFRVPVPVRMCHPFKRALLRGEVIADVPAEAHSVIVEIGIFICGGSCRFESEHPAFPEVLSVIPPGPALASQSVLSQRFPLDRPLPVLDYRGVPWPK